MTRRWAQIIAFVALCSLLAAYVGRELRISSDLGFFVATREDRELAAVALRIVGSEQTRTLLLGVSSSDPEVSVAAAREWASELAAHPLVHAVRSGPDPAFLDAAFDLYFPRRLMLLSSQPEVEIPSKLSPTGLRETGRRLLVALAKPEGVLLKQSAPADPLMAWPTQMERLAAVQGSLQVLDGGFVAGAPPRALLFVTTKHSAFDATQQRPFLDFVAQSFDALDGRWQGDLELEQSGPHRFAVSSESQARRDAAWISTVSLAALIVCFFAVFRSWMVLLLILAPLGFGTLAATAATLWMFDGLHALTLAFGATLIGICTDYPLHLITHGAFRPAGSELRIVLRRLRTPILLAAATSLAGFGGLATSGLPGIRQLGFFSVVGVAAAALATVFFLPPLVPARLAPTEGGLRWSDRMERLSRFTDRRRGIAAGLVVAALVSIAVGLPLVSWDDDVFAWNAPLDQEWVREDAALRKALDLGEPGRFVVVIAEDDESALRSNDEVYLRLADARRAGWLGGFRSLHSILWSRELQTRNLEAIRAAAELPGRIAEAFENEGFHANTFRPFATALSDPPPSPLTPEDLRASPMRSLVDAFRFELADGRIGILSPLDELRRPDALEAALADVPGARLFDQRRFLKGLYADLRLRTLRLLGAGAAAVVLLVWLRYRRLDRTAAAVAPAFLAAGATLGILALAGVSLSLLHLLGLLLVMSLGVDYGIFLAESQDSESEGVSLLSVTLDCLSTLLSFGLLAGASFPALRALGLSTAMGITLTLVFALGMRALLRTGTVVSRRRG